MNTRTIGFVLIAAGAIGVVVSLAADVIGVGSYPGINGAQWLGAVAGLVVAGIGIWLAQRKANVKK